MVMAITALGGLHVLEALAGMRQPAGLRVIAERTGQSQAQTFRVLQALERDGYLDHLGRAGYRLGARSMALGTLLGLRPAVLRAVFPVLTRLAMRTRQAAVLHLRSGADRVLVLSAPAPSGPIREPAGVLGERSPLAIGASGRVILAYLSPADADRFNVEGVTRARLERIRELGHEISRGENHPGINGISAVLLADDGTALGSMTVAGPAHRMTDAALARYAPMVRRACAELAPRLASLLGPNPGTAVEALDL